MTMPFKKNKEGSASGPVESVSRKPDEPESYELLDAVAEDLMAAFESKDRGILKSALEALCDYLRNEDLKQDESLEGY